MRFARDICPSDKLWTNIISLQACLAISLYKVKYHCKLILQYHFTMSHALLILYLGDKNDEKHFKRQLKKFCKTNYNIVSWYQRNKKRLCFNKSIVTRRNIGGRKYIWSAICTKHKWFYLKALNRFERMLWVRILVGTVVWNGLRWGRKILSLHNSGGALRRMLISSLNTIKQKNT